MNKKLRLINACLIVLLCMTLLITACESENQRNARKLVEEAEVLYFGQADSTKKDPISAQQKYQDALLLDPDMVDAYFKLAFLLEVTGKHNQANENWKYFLEKAGKQEEEILRVEVAKKMRDGFNNLENIKKLLSEKSTDYWETQQNYWDAIQKLEDADNNFAYIVKNIGAVMDSQDNVDLKSTINYFSGESLYLQSMVNLAAKQQARAGFLLNVASINFDSLIKTKPGDPQTLWMKVLVGSYVDNYTQQLKNANAYIQAVPDPKTEEDKKRVAFSKERVKILTEFFKLEESKSNKEAELALLKTRIKYADEVVKFWIEAKKEFEKTGKIVDVCKKVTDLSLTAIDLAANWKQAGGWMAKSITGKSAADKVARDLGRVMITSTTEGFKWSFDTILSNLLASPAELAVDGVSVSVYRIFGVKIGSVKLAFDKADIESAKLSAEVYRNYLAQELRLLEQELGKLKKIIIPLKLKTTLDPSYVSTWEESLIISQLFEGLVQMGEGNSIEPAGAVSWQVSDDNRVFVFVLGENRVWSDGEPVTAYDYLYGLQRQIALKSENGWGYLLDVIEGSDYPYDESFGVKVLDETMLQITTKDACPQLLSILALHPAYPLRKQAIEEFGEDWSTPPYLICNGPFMVGEWVEDEEIILVPNLNYWNADAVTLDGIFIPIVSDYEEALFSLQAGQADIALMNDELISKYGLASKAEYVPSSYTYYLGLNVDKYPLDDPLVRQALASAIDRDALLVALNQPTSTEANGIISPAFQTYQGDNVGYRFDPEGAVAKLNEAGFNGSSITITLLGYEQRADLFGEIASQWEENLGITVNLKILTLPEYTENLEYCRNAPVDCDYHVFGLSTYSDYADSYELLSDWLPGSVSASYSGWDEATYQILIDDAQHSSDKEQRLEYLLQAEMLLVNQDVAVIPLFHKNLVYITSDGTTGFWPSFGMPIFKDWDTAPDPAEAETN
jgi:oligopeptide transport system substrate-binding protein